MLGSFRRRPRTAVGLVVVAVLSFAIPAVAIGPALYHITGVVQDAWGDPIPGATVSDGAQTVTTSAPTGAYDLGETSPGEFDISARRAADTLTRTQHVDATVPLSQTKNFAPTNVPKTHLLYNVTASLSRPNLSTRLGAATSTMTITSFAPRPGAPGETGNKSCVSVTDTRTGLTAGATLNASGHPSTWSYELSLGEGTPEGVYGLTVTVGDCSTGLVVSGGVTRPYVVDNTAPSFAGIIPRDGGNVAFANQRIVAKVKDVGGSALDASTLELKVIGDDGSHRVVPAAGLTWNSASGWLKPNLAMSLDLGVRYKAEVTAKDFAGNSATIAHTSPSAGGGFERVTVDVSSSSTLSRIVPTPCSLQDMGAPLHLVRATCSNVTVSLAPTTFSLSGSRSASRASVDQEVPIGSAELVVTTSGATTTRPAYVVGSTPPSLPYIQQAANVPGFSGSRSVVVPAVSGVIPSLRFDSLPPGTTKVSLQLAAPSVARSSACADPTVADGRCDTGGTDIPDPFALPPVSEYHLADCDTAVSHASAVVLPESATQSLVLNIDPLRLNATSAELRYSINGGPRQSAVQSLAPGAATANFAVSGLATGPWRLEYQFLAFGTHLDSKCAGITVAAAPTQFEFVSLASATNNRSQPAVRVAVHDAVGAARRQPAYTILTGSTPTLPTLAETCTSGFFTAPTPCDYPNTAPPLPASTDPASVPTITRTSASSSEQCTTYVMDPVFTSDAAQYFHVVANEADGNGWGRASNSPGIFINGYPGVDTHSEASYTGNYHANATLQSGVTFSLVDDTPYDLSNGWWFLVTGTWTLEGSSHAEAPSYGGTISDLGNPILGLLPWPTAATATASGSVQPGHIEYGYAANYQQGRQLNGASHEGLGMDVPVTDESHDGIFEYKVYFAEGIGHAFFTEVSQATTAYAESMSLGSAQATVSSYYLGLSSFSMVLTNDRGEPVPPGLECLFYPNPRT